MSRTRYVRLRAERLQRGLSQTELASLAGVPQPLLSMMENARLTRPHTSQLKKLAAALGFEGDPQELVDEVELVVGEVETAAPHGGGR